MLAQKKGSVLKNFVFWFVTIKVAVIIWNMYSFNACTLKCRLCIQQQVELCDCRYVQQISLKVASVLC